MRKLLLLNLLISNCIYSQQLNLDTSYANQGINDTGLLTTNIYTNDYDGISNTSFLMPDNSMLVPYSINPYYSTTSPDIDHTIGIKKYLENGSLDTSFGTSGTAFFDANTKYDRFQVNGITVQPDGKIILVGRNHSVGSNGVDYQCFICRFNANGTKDTTFGTNGLVKLNTYIENTADVIEERFQNVALDNQNRIIAVGYANWYLGSGNYEGNAKAIRFLPNGTIDTTFATNGILELMINGEDRFSSIYPIADNHFILLGRTNPAQNVNNLLVAKIDIDGHFDTTFGTDGITQINFGGTNSIYPVKIFFQPNNNMMVVGLLIGGAGVAFAKLDTNGSLDTSFSVDGKSTTAIPVTGHEPIGNEGYPGIGFNNIELLPDNKYIITSTVRIINSYDYAIARLNENTTLDYSFMSNGVFVNNDATTFDWARGLHVQNDGKLVVVINSKLFRYMNFSVLSINDFE
jgi:uncharacterized delta-60 repeat protein